MQGCKDEHAVMERMISSSGKLVLLDKFLPRLRREGHRVLIFSQMTRMLTLIEDYLVYRHYSYCRLDGKVHGAQREEQVKRFEAPNSDVFCFLLSTRAGGLGLTLTSADTVIIYDSDWNLMNDAQAIDRAHRIGQTKNVRVYRLLTTRSYEEKMFHQACLKLTLDKLVMTGIGRRVGEGAAAGAEEAAPRGRGRPRKRASGGGAEGAKATAGGSSIPFDKAELEELLRRGAYDVFADKDGDARSLQFCDDDIDRIMTRSHTIHYTDAPSAADSASPSPSAVDSAFSQATFVPAGASEALSLDDPLFWSKLGLVDRQAGADSELMTNERRQRRLATYNEDELERSLLDPDDGRRTRKRKVATCAGCSLPTSIDDPIPILLCDKCSDEWHLNCIQPPLESVPAEEVEWFCITCEAKREEKQRRKAEKRLLKKVKLGAEGGSGGSVEQAGGLRATVLSAAQLTEQNAALEMPAFCVTAEEKARFQQLMLHYRAYYTQAPLQQVYVTVCTYFQEELQKRERALQEALQQQQLEAAKELAQPPRVAAATAAVVTFSASDASRRPMNDKRSTAQAAATAVSEEIRGWRQQLRRRKEAALQRLEEALQLLAVNLDSGPEIHKSSRSIRRQIDKLREELGRDNSQQPNGHSRGVEEQRAVLKPSRLATSSPLTIVVSPRRAAPSSAAAPSSRQPATDHPAAPSAADSTSASAPSSSTARTSSEEAYRLSYLAHEKLNGGGKRRCWGAGCERVEEDGAVGLFSVCGACLTACYCSRDCQVAHWRAGHSTECKQIAKSFKEKMAPVAEHTSTAGEQVVA